MNRMFKTSKILAHLIGATIAKAANFEVEKENAGGAGNESMMEVESGPNEFGFPYQNGEKSPYFEFIKGTPPFLHSPSILPTPQSPLLSPSRLGRPLSGLWVSFCLSPWSLGPCLLSLQLITLFLLLLLLLLLYLCVRSSRQALFHLCGVRS